MLTDLGDWTKKGAPKFYTGTVDGTNAYILTGSMVVENIFTIGGLGTEFVTSIVNRDYTMIMAITIFLAVLMVVANLLTDIAYKLIDPRITFE